MEQSRLKEKLDTIVSAENSKWEEKAQWRKENKQWLLKSAAIALKILQNLKEKGLTQAELAARLGISAQQVSKIIKGQENLTLDTISKIESCLKIELISIPAQQTATNTANTANMVYK